MAQINLRRRRAAVVALSLCAHALVLLALVWAPRETPAAYEPPTYPVAMIDAQALRPKPEPPGAAPPAKVQPPPPRKPPPIPPPIPPRYTPPAPLEPAPPAYQTIDADAARAMSGGLAGEGGAGGGSGTGSGGGEACDMAQWVKGRLEHDHRVRAALADIPRPAASRATLIPVWNGDWVRHTAQEGEGLAVLREATMMAVLAAPEACRAQAVRGQVPILLSQGPTLITLSAAEWRWRDLLFARGAGPR